MRWLEEEVTRITGKNDQMMKENLLLRHVLEEQAGKINELVRRNDKREAALKTSSTDVKSEPVVEVAPVATPVVAPKSVQAAPAKKAAIWRPGVEEETPAPVKSEPVTVQAATTTAADIARENLVQMRLNLPIAQPAPTQAAASLPYAAMLEQVNILPICVANWKLRSRIRT